MPFILGRGWISGFILFQRLRWPETRQIYFFQRLSRICGSLLNGKLGLDFLLLNSARKMWYLGVRLISTAPMARNTENPRFFKDGCWNKVHSRQIVHDFRGFVGLYQFSIFCYQILLIKYAIYIGPRVDLGVHSISTAPMARNTENPRFFKDGCWNKEHSQENSMILVDLRVSTNFGVSNVELGLDFLLLNSANKMWHLYEVEGGSRGSFSSSCCWWWRWWWCCCCVLVVKERESERERESCCLRNRKGEVVKTMYKFVCLVR